MAMGWRTIRRSAPRDERAFHLCDDWAFHLCDDWAFDLCDDWAFDTLVYSAVHTASHPSHRVAPPRAPSGDGVPARRMALAQARRLARSASSCGGWGREGVRSEARAKQATGGGGRSAPDPDYVTADL